MYESLVFFSWCIALLNLLWEWKLKSRFLGAFTMPFAFLFIAYASLAPGISDRIDPLIPALQSNWLHAHVITCFISYASFALSCAMSIIYLMKLREKEKGQEETRLTTLFPSLDSLDGLVYKTIVVGFPLLTLGIVTGAAWANYAWGSYWSWDPKETWSLITWFVYAIFLHARFAREWRGKRTALLSIIGFAAVIFTYFGVNYVLSGLHSYA
jgi:cytochrome c-type biogenesis protein CcsB